jgi:peptidyl-prolyl cis-trans isomerase D
MLATLRHASHSFIVKILLLLLVASFALWGLGDIVSGQPTQSVATIGHANVSEQEYLNELMRLRTNMGEYFTPEIIEKLNLFDLSLGDLISNKLISQESEFMHLSVGEEMLKEALASDPQFKNDKGVFDRSTFDQRLRQLRMSEKNYLVYTADSLKQSLIEQTLTPAAIYDEALVDMLYSIQEEEREALAFVVKHAGDVVISTPTEEQLRLYYEANKSAYIAPEYRVLNYVLLDKEAVKDSIVISEENLREAYIARQKELISPEKRDVLQLLYHDKALAEQAYSLLRTNTAFDAVVKSVPPVNTEATSLGMVTKNQLPTAQEIVFSLEKKDFTTPVKTEFGWHIFYVKDIQLSKTPSFESLRTQLRQELEQQNINEVLAEMVEKLEDSMAAGLTIADIAASLKVPLHVTDAIDSHGQGGDNHLALNPAVYGALIEQGFRLKKNETSEVTRLNDGGYFIVQPTHISAERERALEEVQGFVASDWTREQQRQAIKEYGKKVNQALTSVKDISEARAVLAQYDVTIMEVVRAKRSGITTKKLETLQADQLSEAFTQNLFKQTEENKPLKLTSYNDDAFLGGIYLKTLQKSDSQKDERYTEIKQRLTRLYEQEISQQYLFALQKRFPVSRNQAVLKQIEERF